MGDQLLIDLLNRIRQKPSILRWLATGSFLTNSLSTYIPDSEISKFNRMDTLAF